MMAGDLDPSRALARPSAGRDRAARRGGDEPDPGPHPFAPPRLVRDRTADHDELGPDLGAHARARARLTTPAPAPAARTSAPSPSRSSAVARTPPSAAS